MLARHAPVYQSLPLGWLRGLTPGGRALFAGRVATALAASTSHRATTLDVDPIAEDAGRDFPSRLIAALPQNEPYNLIVITDPDLAAALFAAPAALAEIKRRLRGILILPVEATSRIQLVGTTGLAGVETAGDQLFRWVDGSPARCVFHFHNAGPDRTVQFAFTPWLSAFASTGRSRRRTALTIRDRLGKRRESIALDQRQQIRLHLQQGLSLVAIGIALPAGTVGDDPRLLSMAFAGPTLMAEDGAIVLDQSGFADGPADMSVASLRTTFHRAGFYEVGGYACSAVSDIGVALATTCGSPQLGIHMDYDQLISTEPAGGTGATYWLAVGDRIETVS